MMKNPAVNIMMSNFLVPLPLSIIDVLTGESRAKNEKESDSVNVLTDSFWKLPSIAKV